MATDTDTAAATSDTAAAAAACFWNGHHKLGYICSEAEFLVHDCSTLDGEPIQVCANCARYYSCQDHVGFSLRALANVLRVLATGLIGWRECLKQQRLQGFYPDACSAAVAPIWACECGRWVQGLDHRCYVVAGCESEARRLG